MNILNFLTNISDLRISNLKCNEILFKNNNIKKAILDIRADWYGKIEISNSNINNVSIENSEQIPFYLYISGKPCSHGLVYPGDIYQACLWP